MPRYTNVPPDNQNGISLPIFRTPTSGKLHAIVTSTDLIGTNTHFWGGHTVPCTLPNCEAHDHGIPFRWHAYLTAFNPHKGLHFLYECTATAAEIFCAYRKENTHLRGCTFEAYRWRSQRNGRVMLRCQPGPDNTIHLPPPPNLEAILAILWQLPKDEVQVSGHRDLAASIAGVVKPVDPSAPPNPEGPSHEVLEPTIPYNPPQHPPRDPGPAPAA